MLPYLAARGQRLRAVGKEYGHYCCVVLGRTFSGARYYGKYAGAACARVLVASHLP